MVDTSAKAYDGTPPVARGHYGYPDDPDGRLRTSAPQLARFLLTFAQKGQCGQRVLKQATVDTMETVQREDLAVAMRSPHDLHATASAAHFGGLTVPPPGLQPSADCWIAASAAVKTAGSPSPTFQ